MTMPARILVGVLAVSASCLPLGVAPAPVPDADVGLAADRLLEALHERGWFNGAVVLSRGEEEIYARGFGPANVEANVLFTPDTPADGGSIAKTLTAAAVLMLVDQDRLGLDDLVRDYLPEHPHASTRVRHLITHSAGLPDYEFFDPLIPPDRVRTTQLLLEVLAREGTPPAFEPGTRFSYDNLAFDLAALVVERVTGIAWEMFLKRHVFDPLGMGATFLRPARLADWRGVRTLSYRRQGGALVPHDVWDNEGFYGASNLYFSARDLDRWSRSFYTRPVFNAAVLARGRQPAVGVGGSSGLTLMSWYYPDQGRRYHYPGAIQGFWSVAYRDEDRRHSVVYVSNTDMPQWLRPLLTRALIDLVEGGAPALPQPPTLVPLKRDETATIAGRYAVPDLGAVTIDADQGALSIRIDDGLRYPAFVVGNGVWYVPGLDVWFGLERAANADHLRWLSVFRVTEGERMD